MPLVRARSDVTSSNGAMGAGTGEQGKKSGWAWPTLEILAVV